MKNEAGAAAYWWGESRRRWGFVGRVVPALPTQARPLRGQNGRPARGPTNRAQNFVRPVPTNSSFFIPHSSFLINILPRSYGLGFWLMCLSSFLFFLSFNLLLPELPDHLTALGGGE